MPDERKRPEPAVEAVLTLLCELFPKAFARYEARRRPLKIGIYDDLITALDGAVTVAELSAALRVYCTNRVYRSRLIAGAARIDLNGEPAGTVSVEHALAAMPKPKPNDLNRSASRPPAPAKPKPRPPKPPAPPPPEPLPPAASAPPRAASAKAEVKRVPLLPVKHMSLKDLREAARRRKANLP
jgi:ProP effector